MFARFFGWLCFWRKPKKYPPFLDRKMERTIEEGVMRTTIADATVVKTVARTMGTAEKMLRMHEAIEDKIGRGLLRGEWVGMGKKSVRRELLKETWFFKRGKRYFVNRRKITRTFGPAPPPPPQPEREAANV